MISPALNMLTRATVAVWPRPWVVALDRIATGSLLAVGNVSLTASLADVASGSQLVRANARVGICAGLAFVVGPATGGILIKRSGAKAAYAASSCMALLQLLLLYVRFKETLPSDQRRPITGPVSPFSFTKLLTASSRNLRLMTAIGVLHAFCEPKTWNDMVQLYMRVNVGLAADLLGRFFAAFGVASIFSKGLTQVVIKARGAAFHTSMSNIAAALAFFAWGASPSSRVSSIIAPLALAPIFLDRRAGVASRANDLAMAAGLGKGEHAAMSGNLSALVVSLAPVLFGRIYEWGNAKPGRRPGLGLWAAALFALAAEAVHSCVKDVQGELTSDPLHEDSPVDAEQKKTY